MPQPPVITIVDSRDPGEPGEVLQVGRERTPLRLPRKVLILGLAMTFLGAGTIVGVQRYQRHQAEGRRRAAAFAAADAVRLRVTLDPGGVMARDGAQELYGPSGAPPPTGRPPAEGELDLPLTVSEDPEGRDTVLGATLEGSDLGFSFDSAGLESVPPGASAEWSLPMSLRCSGVAAGHYPRLGSLVLTVAPESGRPHRIVLSLTSSKSSEQLALTACDLPDPAGVPTATIEEQHGRLLLGLTGVPRVPSALHVLTISSPGLALAEIGGDQPVEPNVERLVDLSVRVTDCAVARAGNGAVRLTLRDDRRTYTVLAVDASPASFREPGSAWLRAKVARFCA